MLSPRGHALIEAEKANYSISWMCRMLGVARSSFYAWRHRAETPSATYGHNHRNIVHTGQTVQPGRLVAEVGNRGASSGPHVHVQIEVNGQPVHPVLFDQQQSVPPLCGLPGTP